MVDFAQEGERAAALAEFPRELDVRDGRAERDGTGEDEAEPRKWTSKLQHDAEHGEDPAPDHAPDRHREGRVPAHLLGVGHRPFSALWRSTKNAPNAPASAPKKTVAYSASATSSHRAKLPGIVRGSPLMAARATSCSAAA